MSIYLHVCTVSASLKHAVEDDEHRPAPDDNLYHPSQLSPVVSQIAHRLNICLVID